MAENPVARTSAPRQVVRGAQTAFDTVWVEPDGTPIPMADPTTYPLFSVILPDETVLVSGSAVNLGEGRYRASVFIPSDAPLTSPDRPWRVQWTALTPTNRVIERSNAFEVIDSVEGDPTERAQTYLMMLGDSERLIARYFTEQDEITVQIRTPDNCVVFESSGPPGTSGSSLQVVHEQGTVAYYIDTTPAEQVGLYQVVWKARQTKVSPSVTTVQALRVAEPIFWSFEPSLRMMLDKVQKRVGLVYSYSTADLYEYMVRGVGLVNGTPPVPTQWSLGGYPHHMGFEEYFLLSAGWWALQAQYLAEGESMFDYGGSATTLSVDRTGIYESAMGRMREYIDANLPKAKSNWMRAQSNGTFMGRPYNFSLSNTVFRVDESAGNQPGTAFMATFSRLGLF